MLLTIFVRHLLQWVSDIQSLDMLCLTAIKNHKKLWISMLTSNLTRGNTSGWIANDKTACRKWVNCLHSSELADLQIIRLIFYSVFTSSVVMIMQRVGHSSSRAPIDRWRSTVVRRPIDQGRARTADRSVLRHRKQDDRDRAWSTMIEHGRLWSTMVDNDWT